MIVKEAGKLELAFTPRSGGEKRSLEVFDFDGPGQGLAMSVITDRQDRQAIKLSRSCVQVQHC